MIIRGANPSIVSYDGRTSYRIFSLDHLSNLPSQKSVYFSTRPFPDDFKQQNEFPDPWFYKTGVFDGKCDSLIGQGAAGTVISGEWFGKKAAFKFVEIKFVDIGIEESTKNMTDNLHRLDKKLSEMISIQSTVGSKIVSFYGHYR